MAKLQSVCRSVLLVCGVVLAMASAGAQPASGPTPASAAGSATEAPAPRWMPVPRVVGRLTASELGLVINTADPYSVAVGEHYIAQRGLKASQVLRLELPLRAVLTREEFEPLQQAIEQHFGDDIQALALAWTQPYAVQCQSITGVLALGFDPQLCRQTCARSRLSPYFNSPSSRPWRDHHLRPSMLLASRDVEEARRLIERGVSADGRLGRRWSLPAHAVYLSTGDAARNVRHVLFPPPGPIAGLGVDVQVLAADQPRGQQRLLLMQTGMARLANLESLSWIDGALADHLTSFGGQLDAPAAGQSSALEWLASGATASYGTVSEPCSHLQKFPHPQLLLLHYLQGSTALEAYWKSVAWPQQGVFVGEPLAAPFSRDGISLSRAKGR